VIPEICNALAARDYKQPRAEDGVAIIPVAHSLRGEGFDATEDGTERGIPLVPVAFDSKGSEVETREDGASPTLRAMTHFGSHANGGGQIAVAFAQNTRDEVRLIGGDGAMVGALGAEPGMKQQAYVAIAFDAQAAGDTAHAAGVEVAGALHGGGKHGGRSAVAFDLRGREGGADLEGPHETASIRAADGGSSRSYLALPWAVRRLTPVECERLQGFPDGYTDVPFLRNLTPDGVRYKQLGNSMAVNAMDWLGHRIDLVERILRGLAK
jgi:DNA (cytosine-5)-methyltransferase 1